MDIATLTALAGNTLVAAAVTDMFEDVRHKVASLFGRGKADLGTARRLDATRSQLATVAPEKLEEMQSKLAADWALRLKDLIEDHPSAESSLRTLVDEIRARLPAASPSPVTNSTVVAGRDIWINASGGSI